VGAAVGSDEDLHGGLSGCGTQVRVWFGHRRRGLRQINFRKFSARSRLRYARAINDPERRR
ncbi:MAG TPA: hypothetical protein VIM34_16750, partial [Burkholderiaceae bacterium]